MYISNKISSGVAGMVAYIESRAATIAQTNIYSSRFTLARAIIALNTFITIAFTNWHLLFPRWYNQSVKAETIFDKYTIYMLFRNNINVALIISMLVLLWVMSGFLPRLSAIFHFWIAFSFFKFCPIIDGGDQIASNLTLLILFIELGDNRINGWRNDTKAGNEFVNITNNAILGIVKLQMAVLYFHAFFEKLKVEEWLDGTVTYYWFTHNIFGFPLWYRGLVENIMFNSYVVTTATWGTIVLEILMFCALFMSAGRKKLLFVFAVLFHLAILLIHGLPSFFFAMTGGLILYLLPVKISQNATSPNHRSVAQ